MGRFHRHDGETHDHDDAGSNPDSHDGGKGHESHGDLSGYRSGPERVQVLERIFDENDRLARSNRQLLDAHGVIAVNMMSSPGAGKTTLLAATLTHLRHRGVRAGVIEGDIETSIDADRLSGLGAQISLLNTGNGFGGECHLDAPMVARALRGLNLTTLDVVLVENVGNLVCPAEFDVGAHERVMVCSVTEGEDKPLKYPVMFRSVNLVLVNKMDLVPHLDIDVALLKKHIASVNPNATVLEVSARTGEGVDRWLAWLDTRVSEHPGSAAPST